MPSGAVLRASAVAGGGRTRTGRAWRQSVCVAPAQRSSAAASERCARRPPARRQARRALLHFFRRLPQLHAPTRRGAAVRRAAPRVRRRRGCRGRAAAARGARSAAAAACTHPPPQALTTLPPQAPLPLPPADGAAGGPRARPLRLGERVALDELGPVVVTGECTLRRIDNWAQLLPHERAAAQRRLGARNAARLAACRELQAQGLLADGAEAAEGVGGALLAEAEAEARGDGAAAREEL
jgi:hypothetical protein